MDGRIRVGGDVGGTFTDFVLVDDATGNLYIAESRPALRHWNIGNCSRCHGLPRGD